MSVEGLALWKWVVSELFRLLNWVRGGRSPKPQKPLQLTFQPRGSRWSMASVNGQPAMSVTAKWSATNLTEEPVKVVRAFDKKSKTEAHVSIENRRGRIWGGYPIPPKAETGLDVYFVVCPLPRGVIEGSNRKFTVILIDQVGSRYKQKIMVRGLKKSKPKPNDPGEALHELSDQVEKQVASVLKDELTRYRDCGRRVGGLGSIQTTFNGRATRGVGGDSRPTDKPDNQSIFENAELGIVSSDNAMGLVEFFKHLNQEEQPRMVAALTKRMSRDIEYAPVGYLGLLVLFRIGHLWDALQTAEAQLQNDDAVGFSDFLRLLDGLLRFEHPSFTGRDLDEIERFVRATEESNFRILERVAAIRAHRVRVGAGSQ